LAITKSLEEIMATTTKIRITACDNELYILASQQPVTSTEVVHIKSGYDKPVDYTIIPQAILAPGNYSLTIIGINWGLKSGFKVTLTSGSTSTDYISPPSTDIGVVWHVTIPITV
jgi:hypothetical protein